MYLGLDIGTSAVKAVICDEDQDIVALAEVPLEISRPAPLWSEQDPLDWWKAVLGTLGLLRQQNALALASVKSIGVAGQMHGAVLLDKAGNVLRPAILWNDGRSAIECREMESLEPNLREVSGNIAMPGFTAPKLLWVAKNEPEVFEQVVKVLLPKDYIRYCLTGDYIAEMSDAAGTLWLDVAQRKWSEELLAATGLSLEHMPTLIEGTDISGTVKPEITDAYGLSKNVVVAGGAGDNAAGAVGIGAVKPGHAFLSLGTSGVLFLSNDQFMPNPADAVHAFCHCLPNTWHQMSVILSAASCLSWVTKLTGSKNEADLLNAVANTDVRDDLLFLPYLSGERTPHNNPNAKGVFFGLSHDSDSAALARSVLEGVAFALADGKDALLAADAKIDHISVIGGGAQSDLWGEILATALDQTLVYHKGGEMGPSFGAARIARLAVTGEDVLDICVPPEIRKVIEPDLQQKEKMQAKHQRYRRLYQALEHEFKQ
ncbi:MAG: xylulokinase [Sneathiella sp.]|uniref:xylulokinase n=1 Tax=Sneathiella sp. TaxID=1964365 RepID=UPI0030033E7C